MRETERGREREMEYKQTQREKEYKQKERDTKKGT
jgi:hypothetical protein